MASEDSTLDHRQCVLALLARRIHRERESRELHKPEWMTMLLLVHAQNDRAKYAIVLQLTRLEWIPIEVGKDLLHDGRHAIY